MARSWTSWALNLIYCFAFRNFVPKFTKFTMLECFVTVDVALVPGQRFVDFLIPRSSFD